jgi:hypothetical protein
MILPARTTREERMATIRAEFVLDSRRKPLFSADGQFTHYRIRLWLDGAPAGTSSVTYRLHESYGEPLREVRGGPLWEEEITSYGDFTIKALLRWPGDFDVVSCWTPCAKPMAAASVRTSRRH